MTHSQAQAADPHVSAWVGASAGTGKTKVLTDRVLRLLLDGANPAKLLCLTYTKAAAAEMKNRIHQRLSEWVVMDEGALHHSLEVLTHQAPDADHIKRARQLFTTVLDTPDGIKVQTIHAFCQMLIRRFPIEADVAPHFQVIDETESKEWMDQARLGLLVGTVGQEDQRLRDILNSFTWKMDESRFDTLLQDILQDWKKLAMTVDQLGGVEKLNMEIFKSLNVKPQPREDFWNYWLTEPACNMHALQEAAKALATGSKTDQEKAQKILTWISLSDDDKPKASETYVQLFLTGTFEPRKTLATKKVAECFPDVLTFLENEQERIVRAWEQFSSLNIAWETCDLLYVANAILSRYQQIKHMHVRLDYQDLVHKAIRLLCESNSAEWVLYKLDGGIDHILIDEAQDTSPEQWRVVKALCDEFFSGNAVRDINRTLFVVGDEKQSIYSFQGADPDAFDTMHDALKEQCVSAKKTWRTVPLERSFRSTRAVLEAVDEVFSIGELKAAVTKSSAKIMHEAHRAEDAGRVEIWPLVSLPKKETEKWPLPVENKRQRNAQAELADHIASQVAEWLESKRLLPSKGRPVEAGDILILLQTRGKLADYLNKALKKHHVPVAGADRLVVTEHLAVKDMLAAANFLLLPQDDLTLAVVLKSPLIGLSEDALMHLAMGRGHRTLWEALRKQSSSPSYTFAFEMLSDWLKQADFLTPFELFSHILETSGARKRFVARLGKQAEDPLNELLQQVLAFEKKHVPGLQACVKWLEAGARTIKRDMEQNANEVRVMTAHGSKGLQAPIVFLADAHRYDDGKKDANSVLWKNIDTNCAIPLWATKKDELPQSLKEELDVLRYRKQQEYYRLLYVAMTRAEDELYITGLGKEDEEGKEAKPSEKQEQSWYHVVKNALSPMAKELDNGRWVIEKGKPKEIAPKAKTETSTHKCETMLPTWFSRQAPAEPTPPRPLSPSRLEEEGEVGSVTSPLAKQALLRGQWIHSLLQHLPSFSKEKRFHVAFSYLKQRGMADDEIEATIEKLQRILQDETFALLFLEGSKAEVPIVGRVNDTVISGQIDRLYVGEKKLLVVDYKTNRIPPRSAQDIPAAYLKQMAAYAALLAHIYPDKTIETALLWVQTPALMPIPNALLEKYFSRSYIVRTGSDPV